MYLVALLFFAVVTQSQQAQSFGLLTVTHSRKGDFSVLEKYLQRYTETECYTDFISEINIVWNNEEAPEDTSVMKRKQHWKIPVYFYRTTFNTMDHRYRLTKHSKAKLLYSLDDDIIVDCDTFKATLARYNQVNKQSSLGAITTNEVRAYGFDPNSGIQFMYQGHAGALYFTIAQPGAAFIPRHFLELYYLKLHELIYMRDIVLDVKNCDDIFFWAIVQHYYPELPAVYMKGQKNYKNTDPKVGQSKVKDVYVIRNKCISNISHALGYNSLRFYSKNSTKYLNNWQFPNLDLILTQKIAGFNQVPSIPGEQKDAPQDKKEETVATVSENPLNNQGKGFVEQQEEVQVHVQEPPVLTVVKTPPKQKPANTQEKQAHPVAQPTTVVPPVGQVPSEGSSGEVVERKRRGWSFMEKVLGLSVVVIVLMGALYKAYQAYLQTSSSYSQRVSDIDEEQSMHFASSIRLPDHY